MPSAPSSRPHPSLWIMLTLILLFAAFVRYSPADYALPYIVHPDEPNFYRLAEDQRGVLDAGWRADWLAGYPPGYTLVYAAIVEGMNQLHTFDIHQDMSKVIGLMRLVNTSIDLLTMACVIALTGQLAGWKASLLAAGVYAISTPFAQNAALGLPDPLLTLLVTLCALFGLWAWRRDSVMWGLLSTGVGLLAIIVKYPAAPVLILPALFFLRQLIRKRTVALPGAVLALIMVLAAGYGLWVLYGAGGLNNMESNQVRNSFVPNTLSPTRWFNVWKAIGGTFGFAVSLGVAAALLLSLKERFLSDKLKRFSNPILTSEIALVALSGLAVLALVPGYLANIAPALYPVRYTLPAAGILLAVAVALIIRLINRWPTRVQIIIGLLCVLALSPDLLSYALPLRLKNPYTEVQSWFETNIPDGSVIWMDGVDTFNSLSRYDRGYRGYKGFISLFNQDNLIATPEIQDRVQYIYLSDFDETRWPLSEGWDSLNHFTRIKTIGGSDFIPPSLSIYLPYALPNPQNTVFALGDVHLTLRGLDVTTDDSLQVTNYWQAEGTRPTRDYSYSLYITPSDNPSKVVAQQDGGLGQRPTSTWDDSAEILRGEIGVLSLDPLVKGEYAVWLVLYDSQSGERFVLADGSTTLQLTSLSRP